MKKEKTEWLDRLDPERQRHKEMVTCGKTTITRDDANDWLAHVDGDFQRNASDPTIARYRADINAGNWVPCTQLVGFDRHERLINGQHMLAAFAGSDLRELEVIWVINKHPNAYMGFDHNRKRSAKDTLKWNGVDHPQEIAAIATSLWQYEQGFFRGQGFRAARSGHQFPTDAQVQTVVRAYPGLERHLWKKPKEFGEISVGAMCAASYIFSLKAPKEAEKFFESLIEGVNIPSTHHPIARLRSTFIEVEKRQRNGETMAPIIKAWNAYMRGESISGPLLKKNEPFPEPIFPDDLDPVDPHAGGPVM